MLEQMAGEAFVFFLQTEREPMPDAVPPKDGPVWVHQITVQPRKG